MKRTLSLLGAFFLSVASKTVASNPEGIVACGSGECINDGVCEEGPGIDDASTYTSPGHDGVVLEYHCSCQEGWAGKDCSIPLAYCGLDADNMAHYCFHGGQCTNGTVGLEDPQQASVVPECDCTKATDDENNAYGGKYCEVLVSDTERCRSGDYCSNGGQCDLDARMQPSCTCKDGFEGQRCELISCRLPCQNDGTCNHGNRKPSLSEEAIFDLSREEVNYAGMYCTCLEDFNGLLCQLKTSAITKILEEDHDEKHNNEERQENIIIVLSVLLGVTLLLLLCIVCRVASCCRAVAYRGKTRIGKKVAPGSDQEEALGDDTTNTWADAEAATPSKHVRQAVSDFCQSSFERPTAVTPTSGNSATSDDAPVEDRLSDVA